MTTENMTRAMTPCEQAARDYMISKQYEEDCSRLNTPQQVFAAGWEAAKKDGASDKVVAWPTGPFTHEEGVLLFDDDGVPRSEVFNFVWSEAAEDMTVGQVRAEIRRRFLSDNPEAQADRVMALLFADDNMVRLLQKAGFENERALRARHGYAVEQLRDKIVRALRK